LDIPHHKCKEIIYTKVVCEIQEGKDDKNCTRITVKGYLIFYPGNTVTNMPLLKLIKLMLNSVISCKGAKFLTINIKNFYLDMPMVDPEYIHIKITDISKEFILEYGLAGKEDHNGWIYFEIQCGCYGLPQAGILANNLLCGRLEKEGYYETATTPGLWKQKNGGQFSFVSSLMISALNMWAWSTSTIFLRSCNSTTKSKPILQGTRLRA
jgi:hypothetical protein